MAVTFPLAVIISAVDKISGPLGRIQEKTKKFGRSAKQTGRAMSTGLSAPLIGFAALTLRTATQFEFSMNRVRALIPKATEPGLKKLRDLAKELGAKTPFSASQAAEAMETLAMAGFSVESVYSSLPGIMDLASATNINLADATNIATGTLGGFSEKASAMAKIADTLAASTTLVKTDMTDLGQALAKAAPGADLIGIKIEEVTAALGLMANKNILGAEAGTAFRRSLSRMAKLAPDVSKRFKEIGVNIDGIIDSRGNLRSFVGLLQALEAANDGVGAGARDLSIIFGEKTWTPMAAILASGSAAFADLEKAMRPAGQAGRIAEITMSGAFAALKRAQAAFEAFQISLGESGLLAWFTTATTKVGEFFTNLSKTNPEILKVATKVALVVAAIGPLVFLVGQATLAMSGMASVGIFLGKTLRFLATTSITQATVAVWGFTTALLANPITWAIVGFVAIGAAVVALATNFRGVRTAVSNFIEPLAVSVILLKRKVIDSFVGMVNSIKAKWDALWMFFRVRKNSIKTWFSDFFSGLVPDWVKDIFGSGESKATVQISPSGPVADFGQFDRAAKNPNLGETRHVVRFDNLPDGARVEEERADFRTEMELGFAGVGN